jgi:hypothetical protein
MARESVRGVLCRTVCKSFDKTDHADYFAKAMETYDTTARVVDQSKDLIRWKQPIHRTKEMLLFMYTLETFLRVLRYY